MASFNNGLNLYLHDRYTLSGQNLALNSHYSFQINADTLSQGNRFELIIGNAVTGTAKKVSTSARLYPNPAEAGNVYLQLPGNTETDEATITITDLTGKTVSEQQVVINASEPGLFKSPAVSGLYVVNYVFKNRTGNLKLTIQ